MARTKILTLLSLTSLLLCAAPRVEAASCGNGTVGAGEECDDGNATSGDGCQGDCTVQEGYYCFGTQPSHCVLLPVLDCGNGIIDTAETCDDGNTDPGDGCQSNCIVQPGYQCTGEPSVCAAGQPTADCGDGDIDAGEECDDGDTTSGDGCEADCTLQDGWVCTGVPSDCTPTGAIGDCGNGLLEEGEDCDSGPCCDPEDCTFRASGTTCRAAAGSCDAAEQCTGSSSICPSDVKRISTAVCRASSGSCDVAERCDGTSNTCPADVVAPSTTVCRPAVNESCDVAESCSGTSGACPADVLVGCPDVDGEDCVRAACSPSGQCTTEDACVEICRDPQFWATRGSTAIDAVLAEVGSIEVCGQVIDNSTQLGSLDSALEALCVRTRGIDERELYRELVAAALNCAVSEGGTCDDILGRSTDVSFSDCDALCRGEDVAGDTTVSDCIDHLACFNQGGQVIDGDCAYGTCEDDPSELCGGDYGSCSSFEDGEQLRAAGGDADHGKSGAADRKQGNGNGNGNGNGKGAGNGGNNGNGNGNDGNDVGGDDEAEGCVRFEDSCADEQLCTGGICVRGKATSQRACKDARKNQCTIDACD